MVDNEIDLLAINRGLITAPAGCGKTHLIAKALTHHNASEKPVLLLTHTNAGVVALRARLQKAGVPSSAYRLATIDGWAMRLISMFPSRSAYDPDILNLANPRCDYPAIRLAAANLLESRHLSDILEANFCRLIVDEYQDCNEIQHCLVWFAAQVLPTVVLGDPLQAIFTFGGAMPEWNNDVCLRFPIAGELTTPWRWKNAGAEALGHWLLDVRKNLIAGHSVDLNSSPTEVQWVHLDGTNDHAKRLKAGLSRSPVQGGGVLIIGDSTSPPSQRHFASQTPGAVTVESVDLKDLVDFANGLDLSSSNALEYVMNFAGNVMTGLGRSEFQRRVTSLRAGTAMNPANKAEQAALNFCNSQTMDGIVNLLVELNKQPGVRSFRPHVLRSTIKALNACENDDPLSLHETAVRVREENRLIGRALPKRAVGSTLLLKGLEAEVVVILNANDLNRKNLYVAMTRGSNSLVVCSSTSQLHPS